MFSTTPGVIMTVRHIPPVSRLTRAFAIGALALALSGCSGGSSAEVAHVDKDINHWALPLDPYTTPAIPLLGYASDLIRADCLKKAGFPNYPIIPYNEDAPGSPTASATGRKIFNVDIAKKYGYRDAPSARYSRRDLQNREEPSGPGYSEASSQCEQEVVDAGIDWSQLTDDTVGQLAFSIDVAKESTVRDAQQQWRVCVEKIGVPALPGKPEDMPGKVLAQQFGLDKATDWDAPAASAEEIRIATADAQCREESGYTKALYDAEYAAQEKLVKEHASELAPLLERNRKALEAARTIIAKRG